MTENNIKITHGIYRYKSILNYRKKVPWRDIISCRNTEKYLPLPLKFRNLLREKYLQWWHIKTSIFKFGKRIPIDKLIDIPIEFTVAHDPEKDIMVISIVHPLDHFKRKSGVKIVYKRMEWALNNQKATEKINNKKWGYILTK